MSVDLRTRSDARPEVVVADVFLDEQLPALLTTHAELLEAADHLALRPLLLEVDGRRWTLWHDRAGAFRVEPGDHIERTGEAKHVAVRVTGRQLADLVVDLVTPVGLMTGGQLDVGPGRIGHLLDWWLVWRSVLDGRPLHRPGAVQLPADLGRSFTLDDDPADMRRYLEAAGYLHVRGVFDPSAMATISSDMDAAAPTYSQGDGKSWWAQLADGTDALVRMQGFDGHSPTTTAILEGDELGVLAAVPGCGHRPRSRKGNRSEGLFKPLHVAGGISDVPWHKDCSLGRHSYTCCSLTVGISVTGAGATSGQLRVVPGSHRALIWPSLLGDQDIAGLQLPNLALPTETGDVTVHLSCALHMAQPPTERERRVLYTSFVLSAEDDEATAAADARLVREYREPAPLTTSQTAAG